ncbi:MAG: phosphotransacetylase family protein [Dehalococcoidia bacterium]|nr:phosphotransacetylase family protein [Dehalococcoidia bacterium]
MKKLYITSVEAYIGKSAMCLGLAMNFQRRGLKVGYMKPLGTLPVKVDGNYTDEDCVFICKSLQLTDPLSACAPVLLTESLREKALKGQVEDLGPRIKSAQEQIAGGKDIIVYEGAADISQGRSLNLAAPQMAGILDAKVLLVAKYHHDYSLDKILHAKDMLGSQLIGVIMNSVPPDRLPEVNKDLGGFLSRHGLRLYGAVGIDPALMGVAAGELAEMLDGEVLCCADHLDEMVETFMIGAMGVDSALRLFHGQPRKAVIVGGDRSDIQLVALETPTRALILTGNLRPVPMVLNRAAEKGVPVILVKEDTVTTAKAINEVMGRIRLGHPKQLVRLEELVKQDVSVDELLQAI